MSKHNIAPHASVDEPLRGGAPPMPPNDPRHEQALPNGAILGDHPAAPRPPIPKRQRQPGEAVPFDANNPDGAVR
jgi:hypothetical protein